MVIDRQVDAIPTDAPEPVVLAAAVGTVTTARTDATEHLGVQMDQLTGALALVAHDRRTRFEPIQPAQAMAAQQGVDAGASQAHLPAEDVRPDAQEVEVQRAALQQQTHQ